MPPGNDILFSSDLWKPALEKYALAANLTVQLYDGDGRVVFGPVHPTALFRLLHERDYDPGMFAECARSCLAQPPGQIVEQPTDRPAVTVRQYHGLSVVGTSLVLSGEVVGAAVGGYTLVDFSQVSEVQMLARDAGIRFEAVWEVARRQQPVPRSRLMVLGDLLQVLGDTLLRENYRTRQYQEAGVELSAELAGARQLQEISTLLIREGNVEALFEQILTASIALTRSDMAVMQMLDQGEGLLRLLAWRGFDPMFAEFFKSMRVAAGGACGEAIRTGRRAIASDIETSDFLAGTPEFEVYRQAGVRAVQCTTLVSRSGVLLGVLSNQWREPHQPTERDLRLLDVLARQAADLIERDRAEQTRSMLAAIVESSADAIISKDINGVIVSWNRGAEQLFGYSEREAIGRPVTILIPPERINEEIGQELGILDRIRRGERIEHYQTVRRRKDGALLDVSLTVSPVFSASGEIVGASKIARDITARKRAEAAQKRSENELRRTLNDLEQFAYSASHDLQEPIRNVAVHSEILGRRYGTALDAKGLQSLGFVTEGAQRLEMLVRDLLAYTKATSPVETETVEIPDANTVFERTVAGLAEAIRESGATVTRDTLPCVPVHEVHLQQILQNLIGNAIKYRSEEPPRIHVSAVKAVDLWRFAVTDNGIGIEAEYKERIFGIFKRLHTGKRYSGTGIGLAICRRLVERYGGRIWVESELGTGAAFFFTLPAGPAGNSPGSSAAGEI